MALFSSKVAGAAVAVSPISSSMSPAAARSTGDYVPSTDEFEVDEGQREEEEENGISNAKAKSSSTCPTTLLYRLYVTFIVRHSTL